MEKLKVLQINESYNEGGGEERYFFDLIEALKEQKHDIYSFGFANKEIKKNEILVLKDSNSAIIKNLKRFLFDFNTYFKLRAWIKKIKPDIIHIHGNNKSTLSVLLACRKNKVIHTVHNYGLLCPTIWCVKKDNLKPCNGGMGLKCYKHRCFPTHYLLAFHIHFLVRNYLIKKIVSAFIAPTKNLKKHLIKHMFGPVYQNYLFIDIKGMRSEKRKKNKDILFVGRLDREKGVSFLIRSLTLMKNKEFKLTIIGDGPQKKYLMGLVKKLDLKNNVEFLGKIPFNKVREYYGRSKLLVVPSIYMEQFGLVGPEAMINYLPVVASNRGGIPEWCEDEKTGILIDPTDIKQIARAMQRILLDQKLAKKFGAAGEKKAKTFNKERHLNEMIKIYNEVIGERQ
jgi:glycosyltransferase involved in cell wall biosynthesis